MPGKVALMRRMSFARGGAVLGLLLVGAASGAAAQDPRANTRITEADCRNRAKTDEQIVVCGKPRGENPYRIPKALRKSGEGQRPGTALAVDAMGSGIPGAGSNIGGAGSAGSSKGLYEQWLTETKAAKKAEAEIPR